VVERGVPKRGRKRGVVGRGLVRPRVKRSRRYHSEGGCQLYSQRVRGVPSGR
jgi:hypothetical protein